MPSDTFGFGQMLVGGLILGSGAAIGSRVTRAVIGDSHHHEHHGPRFGEGSHGPRFGEGRRHGCRFSKEDPAQELSDNLYACMKQNPGNIGVCQEFMDKIQKHEKDSNSESK